MTKRPFIRAMEVWTPSDDFSRLELQNAYYGSLASFEEGSQNYSFQFDEGLPGKAWANEHPIILKNLTETYFQRSEMAISAGLTCGVAIPFFSGETLTAVLLLFCGDDQDHIGAIEVWNTPEDSKEMGLVDGYFGSADLFEFEARHIKFRCGFGLPGIVWSTGMPMIMNDLGRTKRFVRSHSATKAGITRGLAFPCGKEGGEPWVLTMLSALDTPIANRFEYWGPHQEQNALTFHGGICNVLGDLHNIYSNVEVGAGASTIGRVLDTQVPQITTDLSNEPEPLLSSIKEADLTLMVAIPVVTEGKTRAVVSWYL